ncbi:flagellar hook-length control protein FliK [Oceanobacillus luteolus]|uniref:Flagellar hook-length control protein FliK n=1 Tax=Oceanobacillus luteolus TaxID=1274358 RepID=A0ABW4HQ03_9BACI
MLFWPTGEVTASINKKKQTTMTVESESQTSNFHHLLDEKLSGKNSNQSISRVATNTVETDPLSNFRSKLMELEEAEFQLILFDLKEVLGESHSESLVNVNNLISLIESYLSSEKKEEESLSGVNKGELVEQILTYFRSIPEVEQEEFIDPIEQFSSLFNDSSKNGMDDSLLIPLSISQINSQAIGIPNEESVAQLLTQIEQALSQIRDESDIETLAPKLLRYLEAWQQIDGKSGGISQLSLKESNTPFKSVWQELVQLYQQKTNLHTKNIYALESEVTTTDVIRWLGKILGANSQKVSNSYNIVPAQLPISNVEQHVIQLPQAVGTQGKLASESFIEQFNRLIDANKVALQQPKGQLAIMLRPANLGEMMVRFTQVNGEIIVKIMVTTKMAKEMLEGNMQQLRHMFAPHQVVVERQDNVTQQAQNQYEEDNQHEEQSSSHQSASKDEDKDEEQSFSQMFEELILNEKV